MCNSFFFVQIQLICEDPAGLKENIMEQTASQRPASAADRPGWKLWRNLKHGKIMK